MQKKLTITVDEAVYNDLYAIVGAGNISRFLSDLAKNHLIRKQLDEGYRIKAADEAAEQEAEEWSEGLIGDAFE